MQTVFLFIPNKLITGIKAATTRLKYRRQYEHDAVTKTTTRCHRLENCIEVTEKTHKVSLEIKEQHNPQ